MPFPYASQRALLSARSTVSLWNAGGNTEATICYEISWKYFAAPDAIKLGHKTLL